MNAAAPASRVHVHAVTVQFGDCDPAGIVFFPNFSRWMDAASLAFFRGCGLPPWRELQASRGILGTPVLEIATRFVAPASYGDELQVHTSVIEWQARTFRHRHEIRRGDTLICEGTELRAFCTRHPDDPQRIRTVPIPQDLKALCIGS